jgi:hypothetical protein
MSLHVKYSFGLSYFNETGISWAVFSKNTQTPNFMEIHPVGAELFHADGGADMTQLIVAFRNFVKAPKNQRRRIFTLDFSQKTIVFAEEITVSRDTGE